MFPVKRLIATAFLLVAGMMAQDKSQDSAPEQRTLSVCDVLSSPMKYNSQFVTIRGVSVGTEEGWWISAGKTCGASPTTDGYKWPSMIWVQTVGGPAPNLKPHFHTNQSAITKVDREVRLMHFDPKTDRIWLTFSGVFETREFTAQDVGKADGQWRTAGYGHLGSAPGQLLLKTVGGLHVERDVRQ